MAQVGIPITECVVPDAAGGDHGLARHRTGEDVP